MNRRRSVHFRGVTRQSHRTGIGIEWAWTPIPRPWTPCRCIKIRRWFIDGRLCFFIKKTFHCTDDITYDVKRTCNGLFKNKILYGMGFRIRSTSLQYTERPLLHCTVLTTLHHHYSTALYSLHSTVLTTLHCTHYSALYLLECT